MENNKQPQGVIPKWLYEEVRATDLARALHERIKGKDMFDFNPTYSIQYLVEWAKELVWRLENIESMKDERF